MSDLLREAVTIPVCPNCRGKHFPHEPCRASAEDQVAICSICVGTHATTDCPVLTPEAAWTPPTLPVKQHRRRRRGGRRRRGRGPS